MAENTFIRLYSFIVLWATLIHSSFGDCPMPSQNLQHGRFLYENPSDFELTIFPEAYTFTFLCFPDYHMTLPEMIKCQNGQWTDELPRCIEYYCQSPPAIPNGQFVSQNGVKPMVGSTANYLCNEGFAIDTQIILLTCTWKNGTAEWKGEVPRCTKKGTCPDPGVSSNGSRNGDCCFIGDVVKYTCQKSFELVGVDSIHCLPDGKWSDSRPRCQPIGGFCPDPPNIANGVVIGNNKGDYYMPKDEAEVVCNPGFAHNGAIDDILCENTFEWEEQFGECKREYFCELPKLLENGTITELESTNSTVFPYKFVLSYVCNPGFRLVGNSLRFCDKHDWSGEAPYCEKFYCKMPPVIPNGQFILQGVSSYPIVGSTANYSCDDGFEIVNHKSILNCTWENNTPVWKNEVPSCTEIETCPDPGVSSSGTINGACCSIDDVVKYTCKKKFQLVGKESITCLPGGKWSAPRPRCLKFFCQKPPAIPNGHFVIHNGVPHKRILGSIANYSCDEGFMIANQSNSLTCTRENSTAVWQGEVPSCTEIETCPDPGLLANGAQNGDCCFIGYVVKYTCKNTFHLVGNDSIRCLPGGKWSAPRPRCRRLFCQRPPAIPNGHFVLQKGSFRYPIVGSTAHYSCDGDFIISNQNSILTCTKKNGTAVWKGELPSCTEKDACPDPGVSSDGTRNGDCCSVGDVIKYSCEKTFELVGKESVICLPGGKWNNPRPRCRPPRGFCPDPPNIANGVIIGNKKGDYFLPRDDAEVVCNPGFLHDGEFDDILCEMNFEWEEEFGECRESVCKLPEFLENGFIPELEFTNSTLFPYQFELSYICNPGYRLIGQSVRFCGKDEWFNEAPYCEVIKCLDPGVPEHGTRIRDSFNVGEKVVFKCFAGYHLIGSVERYCLLNGQWSGELTRCNEKRNFCPNPGDPTNGMKMGDRYGERDTIEFRCHPGFSLIGSEVRECSSNRKWSGIEAKCFGANDFDNSRDVSDVLKTVLEEKSKEQQEELSKFNAALLEDKIQDLSEPKRLVLYFLFDASSSVRLTNFQTSIRFAKAVVKKIGISENGARAAALIFTSSASQIQFLPMKLITTESVLEELDRILYPYIGRYSSALERVREEMIPLAADMFGQNNVKSILFILTDGRTKTVGYREEEAKLLKEADVEIYCISITGSAQNSELYKIASEPHNEHVFILESYRTLDWLAQEITNGTIDYSQCGVHKTHPSTVLREMNAVEPWPWMAALYVTDYDENVRLEPKLSCGGSIVHQEWILTAAHCLFRKGASFPRDTKDIIIKLGLTDVENHTNLQEFEVDNIFIHPRYNNTALFDYDIALIRLNGLIEFNPYVRHVCLPDLELPSNTRLYEPNENAYATGWGYAEKKEIGRNMKLKTSRHLKELMLPLQPRERCVKSIADVVSKLNIDDKNPKQLFTERMLCSGTGQGDGDTCHGDGGGPLMQTQFVNGGVYWTQIGIISWGMGCRVPNTYGFNTNVHRLLPWILTTMSPSETQEPIV